MIKIEFEQKSKKEILIFGIDIKGQRKEIGHIFTPAGSGERNINAIQICGWDWAYDYWGCGVYGDKATGQMKKDIQLIWFNNYDKMDADTRRTVVIKGEVNEITGKLAKELGIKGLKEGNIETKKRFDIGKDSICHRCFNHPCTCEVKIAYENPYTVKREQDVKPNSKEDYDLAVKNAILNALEDKK
jgi:hypothetical protein